MDSRTTCEMFSLSCAAMPGLLSPRVNFRSVIVVVQLLAHTHSTHIHVRIKHKLGWYGLCFVLWCYSQPAQEMGHLIDSACCCAAFRDKSVEGFTNNTQTHTNARTISQAREGTCQHVPPPGGNVSRDFKFHLPAPAGGTFLAAAAAVFTILFSLFYD